MGHREQDKREKQGEKPQRRKQRKQQMHPAGPHARPELTDHDATPGAGALPDIGTDEDIDPGAG